MASKSSTSVQDAGTPSQEGKQCQKAKEIKMLKVLNKKTDDKPSYRIPSMAEIVATPWNGFKVISTFSGCGGSCLGYEMAGFDIIWANEFEEHARRNLEINAFRPLIVDPRDIKLVTAEEILSDTGISVGELDLFDGSPPCQAFSTAGKRNKGWGIKRTYVNGTKQCNETLFDEWLRLLRGLMPKVFVAENVSGLVKGVAKGFFLEILADMKAAGYRVTCRVLDAQWLGIPQHRQRTIFVGVREDLRDADGTWLMPVHPTPLSYRYSVREAIPWIHRAVEDTGSNTGGFNVKRDKDFSDGVSPTVRTCGKGQLYVESDSGLIEVSEDTFNQQRVYTDRSAPSIRAKKAGHLNVMHVQRRKFSIAELKRICAFPDDFVLTGSYAQQWSCLGNAVPPLMMRSIAETIRDKILREIR
jgi:DNA (cytosine-5)-methyltransferase 1